MSSFILDDEVHVTLCPNLTKEELLAFPAFKNWYPRLQTNLALQHTDPTHRFHSAPYTIRSITINSIDKWGPRQRLGFIKLTATILSTNSADFPLPGAVFLRGPSVGMLVILQPDDLPAHSEDEKYVLLTTQARVAGSSLQFTELPAGMIDGDTFVSSAAKEIEEELGIQIKAHELVNLSELALEASKPGEEETPRAYWPSAGGCDEYIQIFMSERRVPRKELAALTGKCTGVAEEGEKITLKLVRLEDLWIEGGRDAKALAACALLEGLKRTGKL